MYFRVETELRKTNKTLRTKAAKENKKETKANTSNRNKATNSANVFVLKLVGEEKTITRK